MNLWQIAIKLWLESIFTEYDMPRLVIGAAHTSVSPGAIYQDLREFDITRKILQLTIPHLKANKIEFLAVPVDLNLLKRIDWVNNTGYTEEKGDVFLEIHVNDGGKRGVEAWFSEAKAEDNNSQKFTETILDELCKTTKHEKQGAKSEFDHELGSLLILNQTKPIASAIELLYIDNAEDIKVLKDDKKLDELAKALADAIKKYVDNPPKLSPPKQSTKASPFAPGGAMGGFGAGAFGGGKPFGSPGIGVGGALPGPAGGAPAGGGNMMMDREERQKMIKKLHKKVMGKEVSQTDLNYYLNVGITEDQLIQKIVKSKDHDQIVKDAKEAAELRTKAQKTEAELIKLKSKINDFTQMHNNLNQLLVYKNHQIKQMQQELVDRGIVKEGEYYDPKRVKRPVQRPR